MDIETIKKNIRNIKDFPIKGVEFKDLTTIFIDNKKLIYTKNKIVELYKNKGITKVIGLEARGFILAPAIAMDIDAGFVPQRKIGKLPYETISIEYEKEYGKDVIEIHKDAITKEDIVLIHDDVLATGGSIKAAIELVRKFSPRKIFINFIVELDYLKGRDSIDKDIETTSLIHFP